MLKPQFDYPTLLSDLKTQIRAARTKAALAVNRELILLYWSIGKQILEQQSRQGWGAKVVPQLAKDLRLEFPDMQGLSKRNLQYMQAFAGAYPSLEFVQQVVAQLPFLTIKRT
jgi:predicted nuclease of restriction endonuclease-like (RecB) superfamily